VTPAQRLAQARVELELFYDTHVRVETAIAAMHRLKVLLGVDVKRGHGVPETLTVEVDYQVEFRNG